MEEHHYSRKQPEYQKLKMTNPKAFEMIEAGFMAHESMHQKILEEQIAAMERAAMRQKGGEG
jgi:hypothetical protein